MLSQTIQGLLIIIVLCGKIWGSVAPVTIIWFRTEPSVEPGSISHLENILAYFYHQPIDFLFPCTGPLCKREVVSCTTHIGSSQQCMRTHTHTHTCSCTYVRVLVHTHAQTHTHCSFIHCCVDTHRHFFVQNACIGIFCDF